MAKKTIAEIKAEVTAAKTEMELLLANNTTGQITPEKLRQVMTSLTLVLTDLADSVTFLP